jgi:hypothetical protein
MNRKGAVFAIMTVIFVFIFIFGNLIFKFHNENEIKLVDSGLGTLNLIKEKNDFEINSFVMGKELEYAVNQEFIEIKPSPQDYLAFVESLKGELGDYSIKLDGNYIEFKKKSDSGGVFGALEYRYEIDPNKERFVTSEGLKNLT